MHPSHLGNWLARFQQRHQLPPLEPPRLPPHHDKPPALQRGGRRQRLSPARALQRGHHHSVYAHVMEEAEDRLSRRMEEILEQARAQSQRQEKQGQLNES